jgi:hypothetical protein
MQVCTQLETPLVHRDTTLHQMIGFWLINLLLYLLPSN